MHPTPSALYDITWVDVRAEDVDSTFDLEIEGCPAGRAQGIKSPGGMVDVCTPDGAIIPVGKARLYSGVRRDSRSSAELYVLCAADSRMNGEQTSPAAKALARRIADGAVGLETFMGGFGHHASAEPQDPTGDEAYAARRRSRRGGPPPWVPLDGSRVEWDAWDHPRPHHPAVSRGTVSCMPAIAMCAVRVDNMDPGEIDSTINIAVRKLRPASSVQGFSIKALGADGLRMDTHYWARVEYRGAEFTRFEISDSWNTGPDSAAGARTFTTAALATDYPDAQVVFEGFPTPMNRVLRCTHCGKRARDRVRAGDPCDHPAPGVPGTSSTCGGTIYLVSGASRAWYISKPGG